jgi:hypothetical protein
MVQGKWELSIQHLGGYMELQDLNLESVAQPERKTTGYEFTMAQNTTIQVLADRMKFIGILYLVFAVILALLGIYVLLTAPAESIGMILEVAFFGFVGWWTYKGAGSFYSIVRTKGSDITHLMDALEDLRKIYNLQFWLMIVLLILGVIAILISVILAAKGIQL